ncbi:MAG: 2-C-methyl-D-erythritol 4-phosphate cytidylyltransferase [Burkholderiales bacterium]|nr:2-C-methyl-D-erythritol 4-phosphate cytidylyltransferase [Burkholderiales bacterium]
MPDPTGAARFGCVAIVPAGGSGSRFGAATPKQYTEIAGAPVLEHTLCALRQCDAIEHIFVAVPAEEVRADAIAARAGNTTVLRCAGAQRADTVRSALAAVVKSVRRDAWVLVHDAARPCVSKSDLDRLIATLSQHAVGGLLATPVSDTLKRADEHGGVAETVPRAGMWRAQTPQMFRYETLAHALVASPDVTDEAQAIEALGMVPLLVPGSARNIKITHAEDAELVAFYLRGREPHNPPEIKAKSRP